MMRSIGIFFGLLAIFLVGAWTQKLRQQIAEQQSKIHQLEQKLRAREVPLPLPSPAVAPPAGLTELQKLQADLAIEKSKLAVLQKAEPPSDATLDLTVEGKIADDKAAIARKNAELGDLAKDSRIVDLRSKAYRQSETQQLQRQKADLNAQVGSIAVTLHDDQAQLQGLYRDKRDPDRKAKIEVLKSQMDQLRTERTSLQAESRGIDLKIAALAQAVHAEVDREQHEVANDRGEGQRDLNQLKSDLDRLTKIKIEQSSRVEAQKFARKNYDQAVRSQVSRIQALEDEIKRASP